MAMITKQKFGYDDSDSEWDDSCNVDSDGCNDKSDNGDDGEYEDVGDHSATNTLSVPT
jgi:hypothetical protein